LFSDKDLIPTSVSISLLKLVTSHLQYHDEKDDHVCHFKQHIQVRVEKTSHIDNHKDLKVDVFLSGIISSGKIFVICKILLFQNFESFPCDSVFLLIFIVI